MSFLGAKHITFLSLRDGGKWGDWTKLLIFRESTLERTYSRTIIIWRVLKASAHSLPIFRSELVKYSKFIVIYGGKSCSETSRKNTFMCSYLSLQRFSSNKQQGIERILEFRSYKPRFRKALSAGTLLIFQTCWKEHGRKRILHSSSNVKCTVKVETVVLVKHMVLQNGCQPFRWIGMNVRIRYLTLVLDLKIIYSHYLYLLQFSIYWCPILYWSIYL